MARELLKRSTLLLLLGAIAATTLSGCAATRENKRADDLTTSVLLYLQSLRWGDYPTAIAMLQHPDGTIPPSNATRLEGLRITTFNFEVLGGQPGDTEAVMTATMQYYWEDQAAVRKIGQRSRWWWSEESQRWFMDDTLPDFKR